MQVHMPVLKVVVLNLFSKKSIVMYVCIYMLEKPVCRILKADFTVDKGILEKFEELLDELRRLAAQIIGPICKYFFVSTTYCRKKKYHEMSLCTVHYLVNDFPFVISQLFTPFLKFLRHLFHPISYFTNDFQWRLGTI